MKNITKKQKMIFIILAVIIIAGIAVISTIGFNLELKMQETKKIELYIQKDFEISDIKNIVKEVIPDESIMIQKVEVFEDSVSITAKDITDEQKQSIIDKVMDNWFDGIFLVATNPLDVMTYLVQKYSGLPYNRVIGSGTSLDTARLRYIIGEKLSINPKNVHGYVIGEHGDSEFVPWSNVNIGLQNIKSFLNEKELAEIEKDVRNAAYEIINKKGATYYGIGMCLVKITNAILGDENAIITVSNYDKTNGVYVGMPAIINRAGVSQKIFVSLNENETEKLKNSIDVIKDAIKKIAK